MADFDSARDSGAWQSVKYDIKRIMDIFESVESDLKIPEYATESHVNYLVNIQKISTNAAFRIVLDDKIRILWLTLPSQKIVDPSNIPFMVSTMPDCELVYGLLKYLIITCKNDVLANTGELADLDLKNRIVNFLKRTNLSRISIIDETLDSKYREGPDTKTLRVVRERLAL